MQESPVETPSMLGMELPSRPIERLLSPLRRFLHIEAAGGVVLLICTALALILANSPWADWFLAVWKTPVAVTIGPLSIADTIGHLIINDGLMTIFFFVVGLEVKREVVMGELADARKASLPIAAAIGGMAAPAVVFLALQWGRVGQQGWAVPMATDIAFVVGILSLFRERAPFGLKIFLLTLAIADDLGAVLIIAFVFTSSLDWGWLTAAAAGFATVYALHRLGVRRIGVYVCVGAFIWLAFLKGGVHPTVAGVLLGILAPADAWLEDSRLTRILEAVWRRSRQEGADFEALRTLKFAAQEATSPLQRLELALHPWVAFVVMPVIALANAGVKLEPSALADPTALAVAAGLIVGKPVGILLSCAAAVRSGAGTLPTGVNWRMLAGGACLGGVGFTMAIFLNGLAFPPDEAPLLHVAGKIGALTGSAASVALGAALLLSGPRPAPAPSL